MEFTKGDKVPSQELIHPCPTSQWVDVNDRLPEEEDTYMDEVLAQTNAEEIVLRHFHEVIKYRGDRFTAWMSPPVPYEPPVKLRESCKGCTFKRGYGTVFDYSSGNQKYIQFCKAADEFIDEPHLVNGKPCHGAEND